MKTTEYLDAIKARHGLPSDYALAKLMNCSRSGISGYRSGRTTFDDATARRVADLLDLDAVEVVIAAHAERAKAPEDRALWERALSRLSHTPPSSTGKAMCIM